MIHTDGKTLEQVVVEIIQAITNQGGQCLKEGSSTNCVYGNSEGRHCGIGWLLPADNDELMKDSGSVTTLANIYNKGELGPNDQFIRENVVLLQLMQVVHDRNTLRNLQVSVNKICQECDLTKSIFTPWVELRTKQLAEVS